MNCGLRDRETVKLRWDWIHDIDGVGLIAVIPAKWKGESITKGGKYDRVVPLNRICLSILEECGGQHNEFIFIYDGKPVTRMVNTNWNNARKDTAEQLADFPADLHFHDCRHTFGHRLLEAGVDKDTRRALLGHKSGDITDHYSQGDLIHLTRCVNKITIPNKAVPVLSLAKVYKRSADQIK